MLLQNIAKIHGCKQIKQSLINYASVWSQDSLLQFTYSKINLGIIVSNSQKAVRDPEMEQKRQRENGIQPLLFSPSNLKAPRQLCSVIDKLYCEPACPTLLTKY